MTVHSLQVLVGPHKYYGLGWLEHQWITSVLQTLAESPELSVLKEHLAEQFTFSTAETEEIDLVGQLHWLHSFIDRFIILDLVLNIFGPLQACLQSKEICIPKSWGLSMYD